MTDASAPPENEFLEFRGYQIHLSRNCPEWLAFVALPKQRPTLTMAPDRDAVMAKAHELIELQLRSVKSPHDL